MVTRVITWLFSLTICVDACLAAWLLLYDLLPRALNVLVPMLLIPALVLVILKWIYALLRVPARLQVTLPAAIAMCSLWLVGLALLLSPARGVVDLQRYKSVEGIAPEAAAGLHGADLYYVGFDDDAIAPSELGGHRSWERRHKSGDVYREYTELAVASPVVRRRGARGEPVAAWLVERTTAEKGADPLATSVLLGGSPVPPRGLIVHDPATRALLLKAIAASPTPTVAEPLLIEPGPPLAEARAEAERWALAVLIVAHLLWVLVPVGLMIRADRGDASAGS